MAVFFWIWRAFTHTLPVFLFFLFFFTVINETEALLFEKMGITPFHFAEIVIAAALIAKIVLVVDHLSVVGIFKKRPLAYSILWKTAIYWILLLIVRLMIRLVPFFFSASEGVQGDIQAFYDQMTWNIFFSVGIYYLMLLFIFVTFQELTIKIGAQKMRQLFFGK